MTAHDRPARRLEEADLIAAAKNAHAVLRSIYALGANRKLGAQYSSALQAAHRLADALDTAAPPPPSAIPADVEALVAEAQAALRFAKDSGRVEAWRVFGRQYGDKILETLAQRKLPSEAETAKSTVIATADKLARRMGARFVEMRPEGRAEGAEWVLVPREQLNRFTALRFVNERLTLAYNGKGRAEGRPVVIDEIWAIIGNLADAADELNTVPPRRTSSNRWFFVTVLLWAFGCAKASDTWPSLQWWFFGLAVLPLVVFIAHYWPRKPRP